MSPKLQEEAALSVNTKWMSKIEIFDNAPKGMIVRIAFTSSGLAIGRGLVPVHGSDIESSQT